MLMAHGVAVAVAVGAPDEPRTNYQDAKSLFFPAAGLMLPMRHTINVKHTPYSENCVKARGRHKRSLTQIY
jgi:hypothetical protein